MTAQNMQVFLFLMPFSLDYICLLNSTDSSWLTWVEMRAGPLITVTNHFWSLQLNQQNQVAYLQASLELAFLEKM
jgi:hypothetical protein